jgi:hypothetical protein
MPLELEYGLPGGLPHPPLLSAYVFFVDGTTISSWGCYAQKPPGKLPVKDYRYNYYRFWGGDSARKLTNKGGRFSVRGGAIQRG